MVQFCFIGRNLEGNKKRALHHGINCVGLKSEDTHNALVLLVRLSTMLQKVQNHDIRGDIKEPIMGQILVRNIKEAALEALRNKAQLRGKSLESVVRELIEAEGAPDNIILADEMRRIRALTPGTVPSLTSADYREGLE